jgi:hypothetical protein
VVTATPRPLYPEKDTHYPLCRSLGGSQGRSRIVQKISSTPGFVFSSFFFLHFVRSFLPIVYLYIVCPHVTFLCSTQHKHSCPLRDSNQQSQLASCRTFYTFVALLRGCVISDLHSCSPSIVHLRLYFHVRNNVLRLCRTSSCL